MCLENLFTSAAKIISYLTVFRNTCLGPDSVRIEDSKPGKKLLRTIKSLQALQ